MLSLFIGSRKVSIRDASGLTFKVLPTYYKMNNELKELRLSTILPVLDDLEIYLQREGHLIRLLVSEDLKATILNFMLSKHIEEDSSFDCYSFASEYAKVPLHDKGYLWDHWQLEPFSGHHANAGEVVFLFSRPTKKLIHFSHACIHIGFDRYLSVWGGGGQLEVATLKDMSADFGAKEVYIASPR